MNPAICMLIGCLGLGLAATAGPLPPPVFRTEAPEPEAAAVVENYLQLLASGHLEEALVYTDLRGMRQYLLERRLKELKSQTPELTEKDLEEISAKLQVNELNPARLRGILLDTLREGQYEGLLWKVAGYAASPDRTEAYLVQIAGRTPDGREKPLLLGIKKLGEQWVVAPEVVEALAASRPVIAVVPSVPPPPEAAAMVDTFWRYWQSGELENAHALLPEEYRRRTPLLAFLQQAQALLKENGIPSSWQIVHSRQLAPDVIGLGVNVTGSISGMQCVMLFHKQNEGWQLRDVQVRSAAGAADPAWPATVQPALRPNLQPHFKPILIPEEQPKGDSPVPPAKEGSTAEK